MKLMGLLVTLIIILVIVFMQVKAFNSSSNTVLTGHQEIQSAQQTVNAAKAQDQNFQSGY